MDGDANVSTQKNSNESLDNQTIWVIYIRRTITSDWVDCDTTASTQQGCKETLDQYTGLKGRCQQLGTSTMYICPQNGVN